MFDLQIYVAAAVFTVASGILLFAFRKVLYAVLALSSAFLGSALIFLYLNQVIVALLQLLVFVGGLSTYLIVAVAAETKGTRLLRKYRFSIFFVFLAAALSSMMLYVGSGYSGSGNSFTASALSAFQEYYGLLFAAVLLLFATTIGGLLVIKKFSRVIV